MHIVLGSPRQPLDSVGLAHLDHGQSVDGMVKQHIPNAFLRQVGRKEYDATLRQHGVLDALVVHLKQSVHHVLDGARRFAELVKHDDHGLATVQLERSVDKELHDLALLVRERDGGVALGLVAHIEVGILITCAEILRQHLHDRRLADALLALEQDGVGRADGSDKLCCFLQRDAVGKVDGAHWFAP